MIVFFDEMDSVFRTRGTGVSSDVETTIVPQLLSEIDGVEGLENVIVIGASNREDMIDPAILRPGRLDVKIKIERPDAEAARDIFTKYLIPELPIHPDDLAEFGGDRQSTISAMIQHTVERMYTETDENRFLEVTYANGDKEVLYFKDFNSGAMIQNIVDRAKKAAIKDRIVHGAATGCGWRSCWTRSPTSSPRTRTCRTPPTRTTGRASPARRASGSSTSAPWSPASSPRAHAPSTPRRTRVSTCSCRRAQSRPVTDSRVCGAPVVEQQAASSTVGHRHRRARPAGVHQHRQRRAVAGRSQRRVVPGQHLPGARRRDCGRGRLDRHRPVVRSGGGIRRAVVAGTRRATTRTGPSRRRPSRANGVTGTSADWDPRADVHEVKEHSLAAFAEQWALTRATLPRVHLYQVHSLTLDSPLFADGPLLDALARLRDSGVAIGFSTSGAAAVRHRRTRPRGDQGRRPAVLCRAGHLEPAGDQCRPGPAGGVPARADGDRQGVAGQRAVGHRATRALREVCRRTGAAPDAVALAAAAAQPWANRVLIGAAGVEQLATNLLADQVELTAADTTLLAGCAEDPADYWAHRSGLPWR